MLKKFLILTTMLLLAHTTAAQPLQFLRFVDGDEQWQGKLETAIARYENAEGQRVDLIAAVHIADRHYYDQLNKYFDTLEDVLYELVIDEEPVAGVETNARGSSPLSMIQTMLAAYLDIDFQLDAIDYTRPNFRHADLSVAELAQIMAAKDESFFSMFMSMAMAQMAAEQQAMADNQIAPSALTLMTLLNALSGENQAQAIKYLIAAELGRSGGLSLTPQIEAELTILGDRNAVALEVLGNTLKEGSKDIGLFYGAAHMAGFDRALREDLGFELVSQRWLAAWTIP